MSRCSTASMGGAKARATVLVTVALVVYQFWGCGFCAADEHESTAAARLLEEAHAYDCNYCRAEDTNRDKALALYEKALRVNPTRGERLHSLWRMAQLCSVNYLRERGEGPRYDRAVQLYRVIAEEAPRGGPVASRATLAAAAALMANWQALDAVRLCADVLDSCLRATEAGEAPSEAMADEDVDGILGRTPWNNVRSCQEIALTQLAYAARRVSVQVHDVALEALRSKHAGTHVEQQASALLDARLTEAESPWELPAGFGDVR